jgi:membrane glycosyltransferase
MGALTPSPALSPELGIRYLPDETPLPMLPCRLDGTNRAYPARLRTAPAVAARRLFILGGTVAITAAGAVEMYDVLKVGGVTVLEGMVFGLFLVLLAWIAFSFVSSVAGFFVLLRSVARDHRPNGDAVADL